MLGLRSVALVAVALLVGGAACHRRGTPRGEIVVLNEDGIGRLDPRYAITGWEVKVSRLVAPGLWGLGESGAGKSPGLAEAFIEETPTTYVARLRPGLRFSDGTPVTSQDVKYVFDSLLDPALASPYRAVFDEYLDRVEIIDARSVRFFLEHPRASFRTDVETAGIISRKAVFPLDEAVRRAFAAGERPPPLDLEREIVGAGPYRIDRRSMSEVVLALNPHALVRPRTPRLAIRTVRDDNARVLALVGGSADLILNAVTPLVVETLENHPRLEVTSDASAILSYLGFNLRHPILSDVRVRRAIAQALDRERLVSAKLDGRAEVAASPFDRGNPYFDGELAMPPYDPQAAARLLDEAGHPDPDGSGPRPRFELTWKTSNRRERVAMVRAMARQLARVGIAIDVRPFDFGTFMDDVRKGNFDLYTLQLTNVVEPDMLRPLLHSGRIPTEANRWAGLNRFRYADPEVDGWLEKGSEVSDPDERRRYYQLVQRRLAEALPMFPLWHEDNVMVHSKRLEGAEILKTGRLEGLLTAYKTGGGAAP